MEAASGFEPLSRGFAVSGMAPSSQGKPVFPGDFGALPCTGLGWERPGCTRYVRVKLGSTRLRRGRCARLPRSEKVHPALPHFIEPWEQDKPTLCLFLRNESAGRVASGV